MVEIGHDTSCSKCQNTSLKKGLEKRTFGSILYWQIANWIFIMQCFSTWLIVLLSSKVRISQMFFKSIKKSYVTFQYFSCKMHFWKSTYLRLFFPASAFSKLFVFFHVVTVNYLSASKLPTQQVIYYLNEPLPRFMFSYLKQTI